MTPEPLNEREFELINIIGKRLGSNQRDLSQQLNLSLGQTNMLIRRLVSKGMIRISQLNKRKVQYLLTPKGISEKMRKSVHYTLHTINAIGLIKSRVAAILNRLYIQGHRQFYLYGEHDLRVLVEMVFNEQGFKDAVLSETNEIGVQNIDGVLLIGKEKVSIEGLNIKNHVDLIMEMSK
ncbi:MAG: winged helix-turn-helix transcriptional regulator [Candidatus Omnitrophica bacterium]|nr:winged helix-turn-helix transcriptional regulator [Candidatus Omnitrophota bacterium]